MRPYEDDRGRRDDDRQRPLDKDDRPAEDVTEIVEAADRERQEAVERRRREYLRWLRGDHERGEEPPVTPFLLIRYAGNDLGARPIPPGIPFWASPDIWVESSDPGGNPVAGEANFLHARVFNLGAFQAAPVQVDFYWADPSLGLGPGNMNLIGTEWVEIPSLTSVDVKCATPWVPTLVNNGHVCSMVNCSNWILDPIQKPFQPTLDRHVGQRNLHVVAGKAGMKIKFLLNVTNIFPFELRVLVLARFDRVELTDVDQDLTLAELGALAATFQVEERLSPLRLAAVMPRGSAAHRVAQRTLALSRRGRDAKPARFQRSDEAKGGSQVIAWWREGSGVIEQPRGGQHAGDLLALDDLFRASAGLLESSSVVIEEVDLKPYTFRRLEVEIEVPGDARPGEFFVTHLEESTGRITIGGYAVVVQITA